jgi:hypothetical protein
LYDLDELSVGTSSGHLTPQSSKPVTWLLSSVALVSCISGTNLSAPQQVSPSTALVGATRASRGEFVPQVPLGDAADPTSVVAVAGLPRSDREEVIWVKDHSGLTWDQLGKVFGVSRRAVHMWANGGRLNESNARRLREFAAIVREIEAELGAATSESVRARLLEVGPGGLSVVDRLRQGRSFGATWGAPFGPERVIDATREPLRSPVGEVDL